MDSQNEKRRVYTRIAGKGFMEELGLKLNLTKWEDFGYLEPGTGRTYTLLRVQWKQKKKKRKEAVQEKDSEGNVFPTGSGTIWKE